MYGRTPRRDILIMSADSSTMTASEMRRASLKSRRESEEARASSTSRPSAPKKGKKRFYADVWEDDQGRQWSSEVYDEFTRRIDAEEQVTIEQVAADLERRAGPSKSPAADLDADGAPTPPLRSRTASSSLSPPPERTQDAAESQTAPSKPKITLKFKNNAASAKGKERADDGSSADDDSDHPPMKRKKQSASIKKPRPTKASGSSPVKKQSNVARKNVIKSRRVLSDTDSDTDSEDSRRRDVNGKSKVTSKAKTGDAVKTGSSKVSKPIAKTAGDAAGSTESATSTPKEKQAAEPGQPGAGKASLKPTTPADGKVGKSEANGTRKPNVKSKRVVQLGGDEADKDTASPAAKRSKVADKVKVKVMEDDDVQALGKTKRETADPVGTPKMPRQEIAGTFKKTLTPAGSAKKPIVKKTSTSGGLIGGLYQNLLGKTADGSKPQVNANGRVIPPPKNMLYRDTKMTEQEEQQYITRKEIREEEIRKRNLNLLNPFDLEESGNLVREFEKANRCIAGQTPPVRFGEGRELIELLIRSRSARVANEI